MAVANRHTVALLDGGYVFSWGSNLQGQLGYGTTDSASNAIPRVVEALKVRCASHLPTSLRCETLVQVWGSTPLPLPKTLRVHTLSMQRILSLVLDLNQIRETKCCSA